MKNRFLFISMFFFLFVSPLFSELQYIRPYPFGVGEKLIYTVKVLGTYIGDQIISIDSISTYEGQEVIVGNASISSTPAITKLYRLEDTETTLFLPEGLSPVYYEKWIEEGTWIDNMKYHFNQSGNDIILSNQQTGWITRTISGLPDTLNYFTLLFTMRSLDYDYYIDNGKNVTVNYLNGEEVVTSVFQVEYDEMRYNGEKREVIYMEEIDGLKMEFTVSRDEQRLPLKLVIPTIESSGFSVDFVVDLKDYTLSSSAIMP